MKKIKKKKKLLSPNNRVKVTCMVSFFKYYHQIKKTKKKQPTACEVLFFKTKKYYLFPFCVFYEFFLIKNIKKSNIFFLI